MAATVRLKDIVDALEMQFDEMPSFLDLETGQVQTISQDLLGEAEESDDEEEEDEQDEEWEIAKLIVSTDRFLKLPSKYEVHDWGIMEEFAQSVGSERIREELLRAIHGAGAFRYFKDTLRRHRMEETWYAFRTEALRQIAIEWCEEHPIAWE